ncbi:MULTISPECIES: ABC transporter ATP-binding protein [unclassified Solwaraspora]|uniref:ABC transporter ATP-binding protein n=1 Tax=unclassified Solwaraspora TaxID=2627926 RepID=UPI00248AF11C|nr:MULTISPECIES: ABC transporter ATP-binding protein [unclassified Solwaraspora]WBB99684.1 ABC transporter ATP-binding protein [Solwaraspora sp. WMMA2059]WBC21766.1 ABC transporter ATP-binding protein [Solwaraspora sp. WMMA2080]WJK36187.1 ABC transporter ATP-binding protein [Solwaraspora sp. WMMA2065]
MTNLAELPVTASGPGPRDTRPTGNSPRLRARALRLGYGHQVVVPQLDLDIVDGSVTAIVGPNGCGKSTLLRALGRLLRPTAGEVLLDGERIQRLPTREVARRLGILPQAPTAPDGLTVADLVARGRQPHQTWLRQWSRADEEVVAQALAWTDLTDLAERPVDTLSGGQRQRAWISMALAQGTDILLLDEPTTYLDLAHQIDVLELVDRLHREGGRTVVMVLHDLNLAARYARHLVAMKDGQVLASGAPAEILTPELVREVFGLRVLVIEDPVSGTPLVVPLAAGAARASTVDQKSIPVIRAVTH